jgi:hypothetical protein
MAPASRPVICIAHTLFPGSQQPESQLDGRIDECAEGVDELPRSFHSPGSAAAKDPCYLAKDRPCVRDESEGMCAPHEVENRHLGAEEPERWG